ncbi:MULTISPECIES: DUF1428 domain-containing protein [unclassified Sphingomonas]|uniref:DUF1428 domain-containing protein n=1 Tax=Sphingomonas lycopersici TaxID=2951807 RepID=UPI000A6E6303
MRYFQGFVIPVKNGDRDAYREMAAKAAPVFADHGATRIVECWGDEVMNGTRTDFRKAVAATEDENVVFSWVEWPDKATCDKAAAAMMQDERMKPPEHVPFDMQRMIYAGYDLDYQAGPAGPIGYVDGIVASVPDAKRAAFVDNAAAIGAIFREKGATRVVDGWGADVPDGKVTDFRRAVQAPEGETVVFGWVEWPDKPTRDAGMAAMMQDGRMRENAPPWNGQLAIFGGFAPILDTAE